MIKNIQNQHVQKKVISPGATLWSVKNWVVKYTWTAMWMWNQTFLLHVQIEIHTYIYLTGTVAAVVFAATNTGHLWATEHLLKKKRDPHKIRKFRKGS